MDNRKQQVAARLEKLIKDLRAEEEWLRAHGVSDVAELFDAWASTLEGVTRRLRQLGDPDVSQRDPLSRTWDVWPIISQEVREVLSPREYDVLLSLMQGRRNTEIAEALGISTGTVKTHLRYMFRKLNVPDRTAAVLLALQVRVERAP